jgi:DNA repair photolyase
MKKYSGHDEEWGDFVDVKSNLPEILYKEVKKKKIGRVCVGTVSDPYQPIEKEKKLMRSAIEILKQNNFPFHITTKSSLVSRDIDLLKNYPNASVSITITTIDEQVRKIFEPNADLISNRLQALSELVKARIETGVFFGPILPYFSDQPLPINSIFQAVKSAGVKHILADKLNYFKNKAPVILEKVKEHFPEAINYYSSLLKSNNEYNIKLRKIIFEMAEKHNLIVEAVF